MPPSALGAGGLAAAGAAAARTLYAWRLPASPHLAVLTYNFPARKEIVYLFCMCAACQDSAGNLHSACTMLNYAWQAAGMHAKHLPGNASPLVQLVTQAWRLL